MRTRAHQSAESQSYSRKAIAMARRLARPKPRDMAAELLENVALAERRAADGSFGSTGRRVVREAIARSIGRLDRLATSLDEVERPHVMFDPGNPRTIGAFIALALTYQQRRPLSERLSFYGAGVYALYYSGDHPVYGPISGSETPIYVGSAVSSNHEATTAVEQGDALAQRLKHHRKTIVRGMGPEGRADFDYRVLVVPVGWELAAEGHLIRITKPIWNKETGIISGFGKHGDRAETRANTRSPWDLMHRGRPWADNEATRNRTTLAEIETELAEHFVANPPFRTQNDVLEKLLQSLRSGVPSGELLGSELPD